MPQPSYTNLYDVACLRKGGSDVVESLLPTVATKAQLSGLGSDRYLAEFTRKVFQSGFVWRIVNNKWPHFEEVFWGFDIERLLMMPDDMLERKASDPGIIRNFSKVKTVLDNALMISDTERREDKTFGEFIASWPDDDVIGLWLFLKKHGSRLGGNTGPYVEFFLRENAIVDSGIHSLRALKATQTYFNDLREESGRSLSELSRLVSLGVRKNQLPE
jgi:3-methyladenine DNA glycosylase Tag